MIRVSNSVCTKDADRSRVLPVLHRDVTCVCGYYDNVIVMVIMMTYTTVIGNNIIIITYGRVQVESARALIPAAVLSPSP